MFQVTLNYKVPKARLASLREVGRARIEPDTKTGYKVSSPTTIPSTRRLPSYGSGDHLYMVPVTTNFFAVSVLVWIALR